MDRYFGDFDSNLQTSPHMFSYRVPPGNKGLCKKESVFQHFHAYFCVLSPFHDIFLSQINKKSVEIKIANAKAMKTMLTECIVSALSRHTGVITLTVKEKSASLHSK